MFKIYNNLESRLKRLYGKDPTNDSWHYMRENRLPYIQMFHDDKSYTEFFGGTDTLSSFT